MHIANPATVMGEIARVVRPGGRVVAVEPDLEALLLDSGMVEVTRTVLARHASRCANPWAGRQLRRLMLDARLAEVRVAAEVVRIPDLATAEDTLRLLSAARSAARAGVLTREEAAAWEEDLRARDDRGLFACHALLFVAAGRVSAPGGAAASRTR
jgi:SAM-dependent methyltransferase